MLVDYILHDIDCRDQPHYQDPDLNLAVMKSSNPVLVAAVVVFPVDRLRCLQRIIPLAFANGFQLMMCQNGQK